MPAIDNNGYFFRPLQKEESGIAASFISGHSDDCFTFSQQSLFHHSATTFVCHDPDNEWLGVIVTYTSPMAYSTAVIEGIAVHNQKRKQGIGCFLMEHVFHYWRHQCVYRISVIDNNVSEAFNKMLVKLDFKRSSGNGLPEFTKQLFPERICMHNRRMRPRMNTPNGEMNEETLFEYFQKNDTVWGTYSGGNVVRGLLLGHMSPNGDISFQYMQLGTSGEVSTGVSQSYTEFLNDGRVVLYEDWEWTGNRSGSGRSVIEEIKEQ